MKKVAILGASSIGLAAQVSRVLAHGCGDNMPSVKYAECRGKSLEQISILPSADELAWARVYEVQLDHLLASTSPELLATPGTFLVCDTEQERAAMRALLDAKGLAHIGARVKAPLPAQRKWTAADSAAKEAAGRAQQPRHQSQFTKAQGPSAQAKKAARRKAKAGRKAAR